jgi:cobalt/nickel transport protein
MLRIETLLSSVRKLQAAMNPRLFAIAPILFLFVCTATAWGHYHLLIPERGAIEPGEEVRLLWAYGHPFEHELEPVRAPAALRVRSPGGAVATVSPCAASGAETAELQLKRFFCYKTGERGDHVVYAQTAPALDTAAGVLIETHVKVILHVKSQRGWERPVGQPLEIVPLLRPYGLRPGWVFQATALLHGKPLEGAAVEVERYNPAPPEGKLPEDEFITRRLRTAAAGVLTCTLDEEGWWLITVKTRAGRQRDGAGTEYPFELHSTFCIQVGEPLGRKD